MNEYWFNVGATVFFLASVVSPVVAVGAVVTLLVDLVESGHIRWNMVTLAGGSLSIAVMTFAWLVTYA